MSIGTEYRKAFALGGVCETAIQGDELERRGIAFGSDQSRAELKRVSRAERVSLDDA